MPSHDSKYPIDDKEPSPLTITPSMIRNTIFKTCSISFTVSLTTKPFQAVLTQLQRPSQEKSSLFSASFFRSAYRGVGPHIISGQQRGFVVVTSKQVNNNSREIEIEPEDARIRGATLTAFFSQADLIASNGLYGKSVLQHINVITPTNFKWSRSNIFKLTFLNWGSRSIANLINFSALGFIGDYISSLYNSNNELLNKLAGGATSGVIASLLTTIPNSYGDIKLLKTKMGENGQLVTTSASSMAKEIKFQLDNLGLKAALKKLALMSLREWKIRAPMSAVSFGVIFGMDHIMGLTPLDNSLKKCAQAIDALETKRCYYFNKCG